MDATLTAGEKMTELEFSNDSYREDYSFDADREIEETNEDLEKIERIFREAIKFI